MSRETGLVALGAGRCTTGARTAEGKPHVVTPRRSSHRSSGFWRQTGRSSSPGPAPWLSPGPSFALPTSFRRVGLRGYRVNTVLLPHDPTSFWFATRRGAGACWPAWTKPPIRPRLYVPPSQVLDAWNVNVAGAASSSIAVIVAARGEGPGRRQHGIRAGLRRRRARRAPRRPATEDSLGGPLGTQAGSGQQPDGIVRQHAVLPAAVGDDLGILRQLGEPVGQLLQRDVHRAGRCPAAYSASGRTSRITAASPAPRWRSSSSVSTASVSSGPR